MSDITTVKKTIKMALLLACLASVPVSALTPQQLARFQARSFTSTSTSVTLPYRLFVPNNYSAANRYPLLTALHGHGERGTDNVGQFAFGIAKPWIADSVQARVPHFILAPHSAVGWTDAAQRNTLMEIIQ
ncbi:MAG: hypothetical protein JXA71_17055, partial [Chitinispirillaceae bacterium]|nr:hypothetical protein [Chitinispirillaceae bacterium]